MKKNYITLIMFLSTMVLFGQTPGSLDASFGTGGIVMTLPPTNNGGAAAAVAIQTNGKIVVGGNSDNIFALIRYNTNGALDNTFGSGGIDTIHFGYYGISAIALQTDGKIVAAGRVGNDFAAARFNTDGTIDNTFGTNGKVITSVSAGNDIPYSIAVQTDGKILVAGMSTNIDSYYGEDFAIVRYTSTGSIDSTFGTNGIVTTSIAQSMAGGSTDDIIKSIKVQPDGKIVAGGVSSFEFAVARYNTNGTLDNTFGTGGIITTTLSSDEINAIALQSDGKIVAAGSSYNGSSRAYAALRYNTNGTLDNTFGTGGIDTTYFGDQADAYSVAIQPDGKIVLAGEAHVGSWGFGIVRYNTNGSRDNTFGTKGKVSTFSNEYILAYGVALQTDGKIVAVGDYQGSSDHEFIVVRYNGGITGINESEISELIKIYPNPANDNITIEVPQKSDIEISNIEGQIIRTINSNDIKTTIDLSNLSNGVYIIKARADKEIVTKKFIKK